ncbi:hypothetical protein N7478_013334 [Penicillium angulare]|uniref:uncharacterized protein n=1 Tax=Penicillium angulare TaxID=116970 RepID=UPI0025418D8C|nr:uncharacterized protein N7478_013334 [Penicillium angulare]KAJ5257230.1 hypothetical protein N7478_013334 [Penicillium angulare]
MQYKRPFAFGCWVQHSHRTQTYMSLSQPNRTLYKPSAAPSPDFSPPEQSYKVRITPQLTTSPTDKLPILTINIPGVGVGNADASPTSALLLHILQDTSGRLATIFFAHRVGTALEPECKTYRLAADVFNDIAMVLDCLSPAVPAGFMRISILSTAGVLRALCGVAGGSSKASLSAHFARWGNLAELNAKDSSQETVISLFGMLVGSVVISHISGFKTTWIALIALLTTHLAMNYKAVRAVQMTSINRQRANIIFSTILSQEYENQSTAILEGNAKPQTKSKLQETPLTIPTPAQVAYQERIFHTANALEWIPITSKSIKRTNLGTAEIGISIPTFLQNARGSKKTSNSYQIRVPIKELHTLFAEEDYNLFLSPRGDSTSIKWHASILLKKGCDIRSQLKAWAHALLAARVLSQSNIGIGIDIGGNHGSVEASVLGILVKTLGFLNGEWRIERYLGAIVAEGWEVDIAALETKSGRRIICD